MSEEEKPKKKIAKKAVKKTETQDGATARELELIRLFMGQRNSCVIGMLRRWADMPMIDTYHPTNIDDIYQIKKAVEMYSFISLDGMRGWCKIWDKIIESWDKLIELQEQDDRKGIRALLAEIAAPYLANSVTGDYSPSIYLTDATAE
jgi:hypothetical protein